MLISPYEFIDTPSLLIDLDILTYNITWMQEKANSYNVALRPHIKTHKMSKLAEMQIKAGANGITVAKVGEAEVMAQNGQKDILIANEVVGIEKINRIRKLSNNTTISVGVDNIIQVDQLEKAFAEVNNSISVRIEIEVGGNRSGVITEPQAVELAEYIQNQPNVTLEGIFCHEGHTYKASTLKECGRLALESQHRMLSYAKAIRNAGIDISIVSIGATPSMLASDILPGITEIRPGTYALMDAAQGHVADDFKRCAATVLTTVMSKPTEERIVLDAGAKALTAQTRTGGICHTPGYGLIKGDNGNRLHSVYDEHGIILDRELHDALSIGDKIEIIPNHICPCVNLYDTAYLVNHGKLLEEIKIECRGKTR